MQIDYERKALKYKMKYLELKQKYFTYLQEGGNYVEHFTYKDGIYTTTNVNDLTKAGKNKTLEEKLDALYKIRLNDEKYSITQEYIDMKTTRFRFIPIKVIIDIFFNEFDYDEIEFDNKYKEFKRKITSPSYKKGYELNNLRDQTEVFDMLTCENVKDLDDSSNKLITKIRAYNQPLNDPLKKIRIIPIFIKLKDVDQYYAHFPKTDKNGVLPKVIHKPNKVEIILPDSDAIKFFNTKLESESFLSGPRIVNTITKSKELNKKIQLLSADIMDPTLLSDTWEKINSEKNKVLIDDYIKLRLGELYVKDDEGKEIGLVQYDKENKVIKDNRVKANAEYLLNIRKLPNKIKQLT